MFGTLFDIVKDTAKIVAAPVEMALDIVSVPVKLVAEDLVKDVKSIK